MSPSIYLLTICLFLGTIAFVFGMKYFSAAFAARARIASDDAWRTLAEKATATQAENQASLAAIQAELSRLAAVETILKQVG